MKKKNSADQSAASSIGQPAGRTTDSNTAADQRSGHLHRITSRSNPRLSLARSLITHSAARREHGLLALSGPREIERGMAAALNLVELYISEEQFARRDPTVQALIGQAHRQRVSVSVVDTKLLESIEYGDRKTGLLAVAQAPQLNLATVRLAKPAIVIVLDQLEKPGNLGAVARTADAAGAAALLVTNGTCDLYNPNAIRASTGAVLTLPTIACTAQTARDWLIEQGFRIFALRGEAPDGLWQTDLTGSVALVLGRESVGLGARWSDEAVGSLRIPMHGRCDSLNLSVAAAVTLYEVLRQRAAASLPTA